MIIKSNRDSRKFCLHSVSAFLLLGLMLGCGPFPQRTSSEVEGQSVGATTKTLPRSQPPASTAPLSERVVVGEPSTKAPPQLAEDVEVQLEVKVQNDKRYLISGQTNLPPGAKLLLELEEPRTKISRGQIETVVDDQGRFLAGPVGPVGGLPDGVYRATLLMPLPFVQPARVRAAIGQNGERLRGPLVERDKLGPVVKASKAVTVGANGEASQAKRERAELVELEAICEKCDALLRRVVAAQANRKLGRPEWANLSGTLQREIKTHQTRLQTEPRCAAGVSLGLAAGHLATVVTESNPFITHTDPELGKFAREEFRANMADARKTLKEWREQLDEAEGRPPLKGGKKP